MSWVARNAGAALCGAAKIAIISRIDGAQERVRE
jgi:hypothetical protein